MGGHSCYEGDIELMGGPPSPPIRETLLEPLSRENIIVLGGSLTFITVTVNDWILICTNRENSVLSRKDILPERDRNHKVI